MCQIHTPPDGGRDITQDHHDLHPSSLYTLPPLRADQSVVSVKVSNHTCRSFPRRTAYTYILYIMSATSSRPATPCSETSLLPLRRTSSVPHLFMCSTDPDDPSDTNLHRVCPLSLQRSASQCDFDTGFDSYMTRPSKTSKTDTACSIVRTTDDAKVALHRAPFPCSRVPQFVDRCDQRPGTRTTEIGSSSRPRGSGDDVGHGDLQCSRSKRCNRQPKTYPKWCIQHTPPPRRSGEYQK